MKSPYLPVRKRRIPGSALLPYFPATGGCLVSILKRSWLPLKVPRSYPTLPWSPSPPSLPPPQWKGLQPSLPLASLQPPGTHSCLW